MRLALGHGRDRAGATGWKLQKASQSPNLVLSLEAWLLWPALSAFCRRPESHMRLLLCSGTEGSRDAKGRRSRLIRETFTNRVGKACAKDMHLRGQEMGKKEVGVRVPVKKRKESDWFKVKFRERNLEEAPHPKQTHTLF